MIQLKWTQQRLAGAGDVPAALAASWEAFELVAAIASASAGDSAGMYPAFTLAGGSAVTGDDQRISGLFGGREIYDRRLPGRLPD